MNATATGIAADLPRHYSAPLANRPAKGHLCTKGNLRPGTSEQCPNCLSKLTCDLAAQMKTALSRQGRGPSGVARAALRTLLPVITRAVNGTTH